jgi:2-iminobutanoate/2-iminopropanoate deaminase
VPTSSKRFRRRSALRASPSNSTAEASASGCFALERGKLRFKFTLALLARLARFFEGIAVSLAQTPAELVARRWRKQRYDQRAHERPKQQPKDPQPNPVHPGTPCTLAIRLQLEHKRVTCATYPLQENLMSQIVIQTDNAPAAVGPYSQGIIANGMIFTAGQVALVPGTGALAAGGIREQTRQVLENLTAVLAAGGSSLERVVKTTVFLQDLGDFAAMNEVYSTYFTGTRPARSTVQVARLPLGALVEIEVIALSG